MNIDDFFERNKIPFNLCLLSDNEIYWINKPKTATHYSEIPKFPNGCEISFYVKKDDLWMVFVNSDSVTVCDQRTIESLELKEINLPK